MMAVSQAYFLKMMKIHLITKKSITINSRPNTKSLIKTIQV